MFRFATVLARKSLPALVALLAAVPGPVHAQSATLTGGSVDIWRLDDGSLVFLTFRRTEMRHMRPGIDFGIGIAPEGIQHGVLLGAVDLGVGISRIGSTASFILKGGPSVLAAMSGDGVGMGFGVYGGLVAVIHQSDRAAVRFDATPHVYFQDGEKALRLSFGIGLSGISWMPIANDD
jgi:hypothetical protein